MLKGFFSPLVQIAQVKKIKSHLLFWKMFILPCTHTPMGPISMHQYQLLHLLHLLVSL